MMIFWLFAHIIILFKYLILTHLPRITVIVLYIDFYCMFSVILVKHTC